MKRILVPTDFSPTAEKAFRFAIDIASRGKGTVILYHTYILVESTFIGTEKTRKQYNTQNEANILKRLQRLRKKVLGDSTDVSVSTIAGRSPLIDNILGFAEHNHIDLIVMGTQGASGLKKTIIGSVAARVIEKSDLPVLLVPAKYELEEPRQIVFATNYQKTDKQALTLVDAMAKLYNADTTVLHFLSVYNAESVKEKGKADFNTYAYHLQREFNESNMKFHLLETSSVIETMETLDKNFPYDIMAMVRRKKTFLEKFFIKSFTQNMAYITKKPLLIVPEAEE
jgi:nucleotide-binding universal stress UspA family protein